MAERYRVGAFELDVGAFELKRDGQAVDVQPKALDLLVALVRSGGEVLSREVLQQALWPAVVVTDQSLRQTARRLREALGEHGDCIRTVAGRGFRFDGPIERVTEGEAIVADAPALPAEHLPAERDPFVGRAEALVALEEALLGARLVTVLGPGGVGKTRLVLHAARTSAERWPGGIWFCDLRCARTLAGVVEAVGAALELSLSAQPVRQIGHALRIRGRCLVLLDNFEQVCPHAEETVGRWLDAAPEARFLATSRERLHVRGEHVLTLPPLARSEAVALFEIRARAVHRSLCWSDQDREALQLLVERLDELPLAIELAAGRARVLSIQQMLSRLDERFWLLGSQGSRQSLRATIDWSWALLSELEQRALAQLSVFSGGFDLRAAEAILALGATSVDVVEALVDKSWVYPTGPDRFDLLGTLCAYAEEKLALLEEGGQTLQRHGLYFASLEDKGRYVSELANLKAACERALERGDSAVAEPTALAVWSVLRRTGPVEEAALLLERVEGMPGLAADRHIELLLAAGRARDLQGLRVLAIPLIERALLLARSSGDEVDESRALLDLGVVAFPEEKASQALVSAALLARRLGRPMQEAGAELVYASLLYVQGQLDASRSHYELALSLYRAGGHTGSVGQVLCNLGNVDNYQGKLTAARENYTAALGIAREQEDLHAEAMVLRNLMVLERMVGTVSSVRRLADQALALFRQLGSLEKQGATLHTLGWTEIDEGRFTQAKALGEEALSISVEVEDASGRASALSLLARVEAERGEATRARSLAAEALELHRKECGKREQATAMRLLGRLDRDQALLEEGARLLCEVGDPIEEACTREALARLHLARGALPEAKAEIDRALALLRPCGAWRPLASALCARAEVELLDGLPEAAVRSWTEASALARRVGAGPDSALQRKLRELRSRFSEGAARAAVRTDQP